MYVLRNVYKKIKLESTTAALLRKLGLKTDVLELYGHILLTH